MIRNKNISQVRLDTKNFDAPTTNRALDNIINNLNPWLDETTNQVNELETRIDTLETELADLSGSIPVVGSKHYISACSTQDQTAGSTTAAYAMTYNVVEESNGISIQNNSQITFSKTGVYNIQFSAQVSKAAGGNEEIDIWFAENGNNIPRSNSNVHIRGNNINQIEAWNLVKSFTSGSYAQILWRVTNTGVILLHEAAQVSPTRPEIPSVILSVTEI